MTAIPLYLRCRWHRPKRVYIYGLVDLNKGHVVYVGQSRDPRQREAGHRAPNGKFAGFQIGVVVLAVTNRANADRMERKFYERFKRLGLCAMNGKEFKPFWTTRRSRSAKHL